MMWKILLCNMASMRLVFNEPAPFLSWSDTNQSVLIQWVLGLIVKFGCPTSLHFALAGMDVGILLVSMWVVACVWPLRGMIEWLHMFAYHLKNFILEMVVRSDSSSTYCGGQRMSNMDMTELQWRRIWCLRLHLLCNGLLSYKFWFNAAMAMVGQAGHLKWVPLRRACFGGAAAWT